MASHVTPSPNGYRIGAVARWSGIPVETLRVWERRYRLVTPARSRGGDRLYSPADLARLSLIKQLVDRGDSISHLAGLSQEALEARLQETHPVTGLPGDERLSVILVSSELGQLLERGRAQLPRLEIRAAHNTLDAFASADDDITADLLVLEVPTLHDDTARRLLELARRAGAWHTLVVYRYASRYALGRLPVSGFSTLRGPIDLADFRRRYLEILGQSSGSAAGATSGNAAPPLYDEAELAALRNLQGTIQCECPRHLAEVITGLSAFERYSRECESRNADDAALHARLHTAAGRARELMEHALRELVEVEGIELGEHRNRGR